MAEFFEDPQEEKENKDPFQGIYEVYLLYFDEEKGHTPLLIYPSEDFKYDLEKMRPIKVHSIWFLSVEEQKELDHVDLEYREKTYFAKKFYAESQRKKRRPGLEKKTPETIIIILALPSRFVVFGDELIQSLTERIQGKYERRISKLIEAEIAKEKPVKSQSIRELIRTGDQIKNEVKNEIEDIGIRYFSSVINPEKGQENQESLKVMAWLGLSVDPLRLKTIAQKISTYEEVIVVGISNGDHDIVVQLIANSQDKLKEFVEKKIKTIQGIEEEMDISSSFITSGIYKRKNF
jgi:DNA-binding Lrp family transcriptional regulator